MRKSTIDRCITQIKYYLRYNKLPPNEANVITTLDFLSSKLHSYCSKLWRNGKYDSKVTKKNREYFERVMREYYESWLSIKKMVDANKLCIFCKHFWFDGGEPGYSEMTPGSEMCISCDKGHWELGFSDSAIDYRSCMTRAMFCNEFEQVDDSDMV